MNRKELRTCEAQWRASPRPVCCKRHAVPRRTTLQRIIEWIVSWT